MRTLRFERLSWMVFNQGSKAFKLTEAVVQLNGKLNTWHYVCPRAEVGKVGVVGQMFWS
jgi:hypothetical protein